MRQLIISLFIVCIILLVIYNTRFGSELRDKCNNTAGIIADTIMDMSRDADQVYQETHGDFYDLKAKTALKKYLAIPENKRSAMDNYRIGNIYRYHVKNPRLTHFYYQMALNKMRNVPADGTVQMLDRMADYEIHNDRIDHDIPEIRELIAEDLMIRRIEELGEAVIPRVVDINDLQRLRDMELGQAIPPLTPQHKPRTRARLQALANNVKVLGEENKDNFFATMTKWTSDTQNVHDSKVTDYVAKSYDIIMSEFKTPTNVEKEISEYVAELETLRNTNKIPDIKVKNALRTIDSMMQGHVYSKINASEKVILANVIRRINIPENLANRTNLVISLAENLANAVERNNVTNMPVCISGRVAGTINSLVHLDKNPEVGVLKTKEAIRNEVFQTAHHEYKKSLDDMLKSNDTTVYEGAKDIQDGNDTPQATKMEEAIKKNIEIRLRNDFSNHIAEIELNELISQANMAF